MTEPFLGLNDQYQEEMQQLLCKVQALEKMFTIQLAVRLFGGHWTKLSSKNFTTLMPIFGALPGKSYVLYTYLRRYVNRTLHDPKTGRVFDNLDQFYRRGLLATSRSQKRISEELGWGEETVRRLLPVLEEAQLIKVFPYKAWPSSRRAKTLVVLGWGYQFNEENEKFSLEVWFEDVLAMSIEKEEKDENERRKGVILPEPSKMRVI